jgi:hypothetical protein
VLCGWLSLHLNSAGVPGGDLARRSNRRWSRILETAGRHHVTAAILPPEPLRLRGAVLPAEVLSYVDAVFSLNSRRNALVRRQIKQLSEALGAADVQHCFLKGAALLVLDLEAPRGSRLIGDIDVLVAPSALEGSVSALRQAGYEVYAGPKPGRHDVIQLVHPQEPALVELHRWPLPLRFEDVMSTSVMLRRSEAAAAVSERPIRVPAPTDLVVHNVAHAMLHDEGGNIAELRLRDAFDLAVMSARLEDRIDWAEVEKRFGNGEGARHALAFSLAATRAVFPAAILPAPICSPALRKALTRWRRRDGRRHPTLRDRVDNLATNARTGAKRLITDPAARRRCLGALARPVTYARIPAYVRSASRRNHFWSSTIPPVDEQGVGAHDVAT